jgi:hypothetical protein
VIEKSGGRKFLLSTTIVLINTGLLLTGFLTAIIYRDILLATAGVYIAGNVSQKVFANQEK